MQSVADSWEPIDETKCLPSPTEVMRFQCKSSAIWSHVLTIQRNILRSTIDSSPTVWLYWLDYCPFKAQLLKLLHLAILSNPPFLISDIWALLRSALSARVPECQKLKCRLDLDGKVQPVDTFVVYRVNTTSITTQQTLSFNTYTFWT